ncbi:hypothetical protein B0H11DRAFT_2023273 [Mycena galericulata]|nr:hypothetical protein B0H11DRAFT_2023273 [Mycena galericulata]
MNGPRFESLCDCDSDTHRGVSQDWASSTNCTDRLEIADMQDDVVVDKVPLAFVSQWVEIQKRHVDLLARKANLLAKLRDLQGKAHLPRPRVTRRPRIRLRFRGKPRRTSARSLRRPLRGCRRMLPVQYTRVFDEVPPSSLPSTTLIVTLQSHSSALPDTVATLCLAVQDLRIAQAQQYLASKGMLTTSACMAMMRLSVSPPHAPHA